MSGLVFGQVAPCRRCDGRGLVKHAADKAAARERARLRRMGREVADPPQFDPCQRCGKAIEYRSSRFSWVHATPGADHPPVP